MPLPGSRRRWTAGLAALALLAAGGTGFYLSRTAPFVQKAIINKYADRYQLDPLLVWAIVRAESGFVHSARSPRGAVGLMQLMPDTARAMAEKAGVYLTDANLADPDVNIHLGCRYLDELRREFADDTVAVLAAYNAGPTAVRSWRGSQSLEIDRIDYPETRAFVKRVITTHRWLKRMQRMKRAVTGDGVS